MKHQEIFTAIEHSFGSIQNLHKFELDNRFEVEINHLTMYDDSCIQLIFWFEDGKYIEHILFENHAKWLNTNDPDWFKDLCLNILNAKRDILARVSE